MDSTKFKSISHIHPFDLFTYISESNLGAMQTGEFITVLRQSPSGKPLVTEKLEILELTTYKKEKILFFVEDTEAEVTTDTGKRMLKEMLEKEAQQK
jgi:hypothetical protein